MRLRSLFVATLASMPLAAQAPIPSEVRPFVLDSGTFANPTGATVVVFERFVRLDAAPWIRLLFQGTALSAGSELEIVSLRDGHSQRLDAAALRDWRDSSAYFNGDAVLLRLHAGPFAAGDRVAMRNVEIGVRLLGPLTQCGPVDNRAPSADPRVGRLVPIGCTAWLISKNCFITAGHCCDTSTPQTVEFNVPPSDAAGNIQHPPPADQDPANWAGRSFQNAGVGQDWCVFTTAGCPLDKQGCYMRLCWSQPPLNETIRITGYGVDNTPLTRNQTQQTSTGPLVGNGASLQYQVDTEGGNSGSPVICERNGRAYGVHTHGGCTVAGGGANKGTPLTHPPFCRAVQNCLASTSVVARGFGVLTGMRIDVQAVTGNNGCLGVARTIDGQGNERFWVTARATPIAVGNPHLLYEFDRAGVLIATHRQPTNYSTSPSNVWGMRDLAFDGTHLYGGQEVASNGGVVYAFDINTRQWDPAKYITLQATGISTVRALAYDGASDTFWTSNFGGACQQFDRTGALVASIPTSGATNAYGCCAWWPNGLLWFGQGGGHVATVQSVMSGFNLPGATPTGNRTYGDLTIPGTQAGGIAGGCESYAHNGLATGIFLSQATSDTIFEMMLDIDREPSCPGGNGLVARVHISNNGAPNNAPYLGNAGFALEVNDLAPAAAFSYLFGFGQQAAPVSLAFLGMNPCYLLSDVSVPLTFAPNVGGTATHPLPLPLNAALSNAALEFQSVIADPSAGTGNGLITSMLGCIALR